MSGLVEFCHDPPSYYATLLIIPLYLVLFKVRNPFSSSLPIQHEAGLAQPGRALD